VLPLNGVQKFVIILPDYPYPNHLELELKIRGGIVVQPQKGTFILSECRKHFVKISCESYDNYYLLAFTENLENRRKSDILFLYSETNKNFEKIRAWTPHEFWVRIWKKSFLGSKINLKKIIIIKKKAFVKQYSWRSAASP